MTTEISVESIDGVLSVRAADGPKEYILWQWTESAPQDIYFEVNDPINGDYNFIYECTVMLDGVHIVTSDQDLIHFYFDGISPELYTKFSDGLKQIYALVPGVLEVLD